MLAFFPNGWDVQVIGQAAAHTESALGLPLPWASFVADDKTEPSAGGEHICRVYATLANPARPVRRPAVRPTGYALVICAGTATGCSRPLPQIRRGWRRAAGAD
jgi:hypothetical protein